MGRASAADAAITRQKIIDAAFDITINEGFDKATLSYIAKKAGISKSGINSHFDKKVDIAAALVPIMIRIIDKRLNFNSVDEFYESWTNAIDNDPEFVAAIVACGPIIPTSKGVDSLKMRISGKPDDVIKCIHACIGYAVVQTAEKGN